MNKHTGVMQQILDMDGMLSPAVRCPQGPVATRTHGGIVRPASVCVRNGDALWLYMSSHFMQDMGSRVSEVWLSSSSPIVVPYLV